MKEFLEMLEQRVADNPPNYGDADSVLGLLYECFNENNPYDNEEIKADFNALYQAMNGLPLPKWAWLVNTLPLTLVAAIVFAGMGAMNVGSALMFLRLYFMIRKA